MPKRGRVVWNEGILLTPQHFQQQDRYHEERGSELFRVAQPLNVGFTRIELDEDAIQNGQVLVRAAAGVLPLGAPFSAPDRDPAPIGRSLEGAFGLRETVFQLHLGIRVHRPGQSELDAAGAADDSRFRRGATSLLDSTTGATERLIDTADLQLRVLFPGDDIGDYEALPLAQVVRKPEGGFSYRAEYIPPCLSIAAAPQVQRILRKLVEILVAKSTELSDRRRASGKGASEFGRDDTAGFWLLGAVNGAIPVLSHHLRAAHAHPEDLYLDLAGLAGALTTMSDLSVREIAPYDHLMPETAFADLAQRIPRMLETVLPRHYTRIPLTKRDEAILTGKITDDRILEPTVAWYLGVYAHAPAVEVQNALPNVMKIGSADSIDTLVALALTGVGLRFTQNLPSSLPIQGGYVYFQLDKIGDAWDMIAGSRGVAIFCPPEFPGLQLELIAVRES